ncbi:SLC13 family permease [Vibrio coralliilyticus]|uniref:SLC13 family permease n=1 Tax=Vibrio coralliilyticus TaxID=190893 RepID=UPI000BAAC985|nr:DASS family sodium-coupled anion symporter [Vibrio coralliilyticus]NOI59201.1 DASS family sodium-coupled anion symporter [Vibrio coralliilyticus]PAT66252.1 anion transporter [Vibrio coralliilyticus]
MLNTTRTLENKTPTERYLYFLGMPVALIIFAIFFYMPVPAGITYEGKISLGVFLFALTLWVCESLPNYVTSLIAIAMLSVFGGWAESKALGTLGYDVIWLMISAFIITSGMEKSGLARRIALLIISRFGKTAKSILASLMAANFAIAFIVPSTTARAAMLLPIVLLVAKTFKDSPSSKNLSKLLAIQGLQANNFSTSAILTATAPQIMAVGLIAEFTDINVSWGEWFIASAPIAILTLIASFIIGQMLFPVKTEGETSQVTAFKTEYQSLGKLSGEELKAGAIFLFTIILWSTDKWHGALFGFEFSLVMVALLAATLFLTPYVGTLKWEDANIPWNLMIFAAGAYAVGVSLSDTGVATWAIQGLFSSIGIDSMDMVTLYATVMAISIFSHFVFTSKTVRVIILIPTLVGLANSAGVPPLMLLLPAAFTISDTITLPPHSKANLVYYSSGFFTVSDQLIYGFLTLIAKWGLMFLAYFTWFNYLGITG